MKPTSNEMREFIRQELMKHGLWLSGQFQANLRRNPNILTGNLIDRIAVPQLGEGLDLTFDIPSYGRFFEIRGRKRRARYNRLRRENGSTWMKQNAIAKKKKTDWYAKTMYRGLGRLTSVLSNGISDEQLAEIRRTIADAFSGADIIEQ